MLRITTDDSVPSSVSFEPSPSDPAPWPQQDSGKWLSVALVPFPAIDRTWARGISSTRRTHLSRVDEQQIELDTGVCFGGYVGRRVLSQDKQDDAKIGNMPRSA